MCLLAFHIDFSPSVPLLLAANREEAFARPSHSPEVHFDALPVMCGTDAIAGGTWLGVNAGGLLVAVTNRPKLAETAQPRSRGLLCRDLLQLTSAPSAADTAMRELNSGNYPGVNFLVADDHNAFVIHGGAQIEIVQLSTGLHLLTNGDVDDAADLRQSRAREMFNRAAYQDPEEFVRAAQLVCAHTGDLTDSQHDSATEEVSIIIRHQNRGTVSSSIITLGHESAECRYLYAPGPPDTTDYMDLSDPLRCLLGDAHTLRESRRSPPT